MSDDTKSGARLKEAKFTEDSIFKHVVVMAVTGAVGLAAVFVIDLLNLFYISLLGHEELAAAVGYAGTVAFFAVSVSIAMTIAAGAVVSKPLGRGHGDQARQLATSAVCLSVVATTVIVAVVYPYLYEILTLLGARGRTAELAEVYLKISFLGLPFLAIAMTTAGILRAYSEAGQAMYVPLAAGITAGVIDPIFILVLDYQIPGAAVASIISAAVSGAIGIYGVTRSHKILIRPRLKNILADVSPIAYIAIPAIFANLALPFIKFYITMMMSQFGDQAVAGIAIINRVVPVAFCTMFSLSAAISPIIGQNYGAGKFDRIRQSIVGAIVFIVGYSLIVGIILWLLSDQLVLLFGAIDDGAALLRLFASLSILFCLFAGITVTANAVFNTLNYPVISMVFNWTRATIGTIPFVILGAQYAGALGILGAQLVGTAVFGFGSILAALYITAKITKSGKVTPIISPVGVSATYPMTSKGSAYMELLNEKSATIMSDDSNDDAQR